VILAAANSGRKVIAQLLLLELWAERKSNSVKELIATCTAPGSFFYCWGFEEVEGQSFSSDDTPMAVFLSQRVGLQDFYTSILNA